MNIKSVTRRFWLLTVLRWMPPGFLIPILVLTLTERGIGLAQTGLVFSAYGITTALLELPTGGLADSVGRRPVLIVSAGLEACMGAIWLLGGTFPVFLVGAVVGGISRALSSGPLEAWYVDTVHELSPSAQVRAGLAGGGVADALGLAIGSLTVSAITLIPSLPADGPIVSALRLPALFMVLASSLNLIAVTVLLREAKKPRPTTRHLVGEIPEVVRRSIRIMGRHREIRLLMTATVLLGLAYSAVELFYQPHLAGLMETTSEATRLFGLLVFGLGAASATGAAIASRVPERNELRPGRIGMIALIAIGFGIAAFGLSDSVPVAVVSFLFTYLVGGFVEPFQQQILHAGVTASERSTLISGRSLAGQSGLLITGLALAPLAEHTSITVALIAAAAAPLLASVLLGRIRNRSDELTVGAKAGEAVASDEPDKV